MNTSFICAYYLENYVLAPASATHRNVMTHWQHCEGRQLLQLEALATICAHTLKAYHTLFGLRPCVGFMAQLAWLTPIGLLPISRAKSEEKPDLHMNQSAILTSEQQTAYIIYQHTLAEALPRGVGRWAAFKIDTQAHLASYPHITEK